MNLKQTLCEQFDSSSVLVDDAVSARYESDWGVGETHRPEVVLRPATTENVAQMLKLCNEAGQSIVTQGGLTGLSGGATPQAGEWSLSLERMNKVIEIDPDAMTLTVEAGVPLEVVQSAADDANLFLPLDLAARGSCQIGGNVATNAGGNQVIKYGMARALVSGMVAVLADGTILSNRNKLLKNNAGYDLKQLFIGSEGTLGVITEVVLRLVPKPITKQSAMCAMNSMNDVLYLLSEARKQLPSVSAFEVMWPHYYDAALTTVTNIRSPFAGEHSYYVILESEGHYPETDNDHFCEFLAGLMEQQQIADAAIAQSLTDAANFWAIRDGVAELIPTLKHIANFDMGVSPRCTEQCVIEIQNQLKKKFPTVKPLIFGHLGDGNIHIIAGTANKQEQYDVYDTVYEIIGNHDGSITGEHGVGTHKKRWLKHSRDEVEIAVMKTLKNALDPKGILNPGRIF